MGVTSFLLLSILGLAITAQAEDCARPEGEANMSLKNPVSVFPDGIQVTFTCNVGYVSAGGSPTITCTAGSWSPVRLRCERKSCGNAGEVENGVVDYPEGAEFGDKLVVTCNAGYILVGKDHMFCGALSWEGRLPVCEVVTCAPPTTPTNGAFSPIKENYNYREVVQFTCENDLTLNGSGSSSCSDNDRFHPPPPTCVKVLCEDPDITDADFVQGSRPPHKYKASVTYQCRSGFAMIGAGTQTCEINSKWSPGLPRCQLIQPPTKPTTPSTTTTTTTTSVPPIVTRKPTAHPVPPGPPGNDGNSLAIGLGVGLTILAIILTCCGCYFCGVPAFIKEKRRSRRGLPDNAVPKAGEDVALAQA